MTSATPVRQPWGPGRAIPTLIAAALLALPGLARAQQARAVVKIGTSGTLSSATSNAKEVAALDTMQQFIKEQTGLDDQIVRQKNWRDLAQQMAEGKLQLGVFQGFEFAWAQEKYPALRPLAVAVDVYTYPTAYVVTRRDDPARDFAGLKGQSLALSTGTARFLKLYIDRQARAQGQSAKDFFSRVVKMDNAETALDNLVDGKVQEVVADRAALVAYKDRKPGRFNQLKEVAHSKPFPPAVVAYYNDNLDSATLQRFRNGLLSADKTDRGAMLLTLFKLSGFEAPPPDLNKVLAETRQAYPPSSHGAAK
jgi:ABC-type phosphate/phosphonate transport system substrate-binding protein